MRITRNISIDAEVWQQANDFARLHNMTFSGFVQRSLVREMGDPPAVVRTENPPITLRGQSTMPVARADDIGTSHPAPKPGAKR